MDDYDEEVLEVAISDPTNLQVRDMLESVAEAQGTELSWRRGWHTSRSGSSRCRGRFNTDG